MGELKPMEVIMRIDFVASDGEQICAHAKKVQELIRCKDCKYNATSKKCLNPNSFFLVPADDDYCSHAERRTDG